MKSVCVCLCSVCFIPMALSTCTIICINTVEWMEPKERESVWTKTMAWLSGSTIIWLADIGQSKTSAQFLGHRSIFGGVFVCFFFDWNWVHNSRWHTLNTVDHNGFVHCQLTLLCLFYIPNEWTMCVRSTRYLSTSMYQYHLRIHCTRTHPFDQCDSI